MERDDYLAFNINWETNELQLGKLGFLLSQFFKPEEKKTWEITPLVNALEYLAKLNPQENSSYRFQADLLYDRESLIIKLHCTDDFASVVDVPYERLKNVIGALLTPRELEVTSLLFEGRTIRCIASSLCIAEGTVKRIIYNIYQKLGVGSQVELVREIYVRLAQFYAQPSENAVKQHNIISAALAMDRRRTTPRRSPG